MSRNVINRVGNSNIFCDAPSIMPMEDILMKVRDELPPMLRKPRIKADADIKNYNSEDVSLKSLPKVQPMPDEIIETVNINESGTVSFKLNEREFGIKIDFGLRQNLEKLSNTMARKIFLENIADQLTFAYETIRDNGFPAERNVEESKPSIPKRTIEDTFEEIRKKRDERSTQHMEREIYSTENKNRSNKTEKNHWYEAENDEWGF